MGNKIEKSLIKDIVSSLQQLDNYDFCFFLKKKYNIRDFDYSNINKILETKEGINNLKDFFEEMTALGVTAVICTDISKDGAMQGANHLLYQELSQRFDLQIIASGGVSSLEDVTKLAALNIHGAIIGKAYYTGAIDLKEAIEVAK